MENIKAFILDMDGVIWRSYEPIGDISAIFGRFHDAKVNFALATNNSSRTRLQYKEKLQSFGINVELSQIITSSLVTAQSLKIIFPEGGPVYIVGEDGLFQSLEEQGFFHQEENVLAVVAGLDRGFSFNKLSQATKLIREGAYFFGTNPDRSFPNPNGFGPGAGAILAAIEAATDVKPKTFGKPAVEMINSAIDYLNCTAEQCLMIGDRLETDILAGQNAGCKTALVLSGVSDLKDLKTWEPKPDFVEKDLTALIDNFFPA